MRMALGSCTIKPGIPLLIAVAPLLVYYISDQLLRGNGLQFEMPKEFAPYDLNRAEAARLNSLGAFFLLASAATAAFLYFLYTLRLLERFSLLLVVGSFLASVGVIGWQLETRSGPQERAFSSSSFVCTALDYAGKNLPIKAKDKDNPERVVVSDARIAIAGQEPECRAKYFGQFRALLRWNSWAVLIGLASLIFGSICCLAGPVGASDGNREERLKLYEEQSGRLNVYLYFSALLLVTGLLFVSAMLRWPAYALLSATSYEAHVNALTAFYGFSYSVLLASFYVPTAVVLSARVRELKGADTESGKVPDAFKGPLQLLKIAAAIFSTSLAGILSSLLTVGS